MIRTKQARQPSDIDLRRVIEPLASYICATDRPRAVLSLAFEVLSNEVSLLNRLAEGQVNSLLGTAAKW